MEKWYHQLEYPDPEVRTIAKEAMLPVVDATQANWRRILLIPK